MKTVQPSKDQEKLQEVIDNLGGIRNKMLFRLGLNTGLRVSDILDLKVSDIKPIIELQEQKTGKTKRFQLSDSFYSELLEYIETYCKGEWLFPSKLGEPLSYAQAYKIIKTAGRKAGVNDIGTHTMRKTFGYYAYNVLKVPIAYIMEALNHSSESHTLRYIGITEDVMNNTVYGKMSL